MDVNLEWLSSQFSELSDIAPLSSGGFKAVFSATHPSEGNVVLKLIKPSQGTEDVAREILAVRKVIHTNVPKIYSHGKIVTNIGTCFWMREQRIMGRTVRNCLQSGPFEIEELFNLILHVLKSLSKAEEANIVHRDVKPENIMREETGDFWLLERQLNDSHWEY